jgi:sugar/nucleoside kinase (ribokinase family)
MALASIAFAEGVSSITITLGNRGLIYFVAPGFERLSDLRRPALAGAAGAIRTAKLPAKLPRHSGPGDPTGCGDVWGATYFSRLLAGDKFDVALDRALDAAARNVDHRGATGLADYLRGELSTK